MKFGNTLGAVVVVLALLLAAGGVLIGSPERDAGQVERINLPLHNPGSPGRDDANEIVLEEDFENNAEGWTTGDQTISNPSWHKSDYQARDEDDILWWCGDTITGFADQYVGYDNFWMQFLDSPELDLSNAGNQLTLSFDAKWLMEDPRRVPPPQGWDGWDGWLVMISTNSGDDFQVLRPVAPAYTAEHLSAAERFWLLEGDWPGWVFESDPDGRDGWEAANDTVISPEWVNCSFDLSNFRRDNIVIRMIVLSDRTVAAPFNFYLRESGVWIDDILIEDGAGNIYLSNNGTDDPQPADMASLAGPGFGDTWALTRDNVHSGNFSMWNDDDNFNVINGLDSPPFVIPEDFSTHLEYWVRCDLPDAVHEGSQALSDFYQLYLSADDGATWTYVTHDYNRPEAGGDDWVHYVPGVPFTGNIDLSLSSDTALIGEEVMLRWWFRTDADHREGDGSGLFIDDIQVIAENRQPRDAGYENLNLPYPVSVRYRTRGVQATLYNYGSRDLTQIWSFWGWDGGENFSRAIRVIPNPTIDAGDSLTINLSDYADRQNPGWTPTSPGVYTVFARTAVGSATPGDNADDDQYTPNDSIGMAGIRVWPQGVFELGHDNHSIRFRNEFAVGTGAAARFTPADAGVDDYSLAFAHFRFNGGLEEPATFRLHILEEGQNESRPGAELAALDVEVHPDSTLPGHMTVDLSNMQELRNLSGDFWLWAEVTRNDYLPQIVSDEQLRGAGRFFTYNGNQAQAFNGDLMIHAAVIPAANVDPNLAESEQLLDFGEVLIDDSKPRLFGLYSTGLNPVTITGVTSSEESFTVDFPGETTLRTGQSIWFTITFTAPDDQVHAGDLVFQTTDGAPPNVTIVGSGMVSVKDETQTPLTFGLTAPYPNPFNSTTRIDYALTEAGRISLALYDLSGRQIRLLADQAMPSGRHSAILQANDLPAGLYVLRLSSGERVSSQKVLLVK